MGNSIVREYLKPYQGKKYQNFILFPFLSTFLVMKKKMLIKMFTDKSKSIVAHWKN